MHRAQGTVKAEKGKLTDPCRRGIKERFPQEVTSALCLKRQMPLAKGKGQVCQAEGPALATAWRWEERSVRGGGAEGQVLSWVPFYPPGHQKVLRKGC